MSNEAIEIGPGVSVPLSVVRFQFARSGGPGGQSVNKLNTKAIMTVRVEDLSGYLPPGVIGRLESLAGAHLTEERVLQFSSEEHRSQIANRKACIEKLRQLIVRARHRPRPRHKTKPTRGSVERRLEAKKKRGSIKAVRRRPTREG